MKVKLEDNVWIADIEGDPGRTVKIEHAQKFEDISAALKALADAREYRPFPRAEIVEDSF